MANWFCSVFNVVCVVNVCTVHAVDVNNWLCVGCHRPWTKMHKKNELMDTCLNHASAYTTHLPTPRICLHHASAYTTHLPTPRICLHHASAYTTHLPTPRICLHHASAYTTSAYTYIKEICMGTYIKSNLDITHFAHNYMETAHVAFKPKLLKTLARSGIWTRDLQITCLTLSHLSYPGMLIS